MPDFTRLVMPPAPAPTAPPPVIKYVECDSSATMVRSLEISKMNVAYIGVDNPIEIKLNYKHKREDIEVSTSGSAGAGLKKGAANTYNLTVTKPGYFQINISDRKNGLKTTYDMRAKRMPDPVATLGKKTGGPIGVGEFRAQAGVAAMLYNFDFDARCQIQGYYLERITNQNERSKQVNRGAKYSIGSKNIIQQALPGDIYMYTNIKARCPGDVAGRKISPMVFFVK